MKVLVKYPGEPIREEEIENTLEDLQELVGGNIEAVTIEDGVVLCNEEGLLEGLPYCCEIDGIDFVGPVVVAGVDGAEFADVTVTPEEFKRRYRLSQ